MNKRESGHLYFGPTSEPPCFAYPRVASLLGVFSFSGLVFGSIPESFALSNLAITLGFLLAVWPRMGIQRWATWFVLGTIAVGVTLTNLVYVAILYFTARLNVGDDWRRAALRCLPMLGAIGIATVLLAFTTHGLYENRPLEASQGARYIETWSRDNDPLTRAAEFPSALANSLVAVDPIGAQNRQARLHDSRYKFRFNFEGRPRVFTVSRPFASVLLLLAVAGAFVMLREQSRARNAAAAALAIVLFNFVLHSY
jgi:hypothetical protein